MKVNLTNNLGSRLVTELGLDKRNAYKAGDSVSVSEAAGNSLVKRGLAIVEETKEIKAVPEKPAISKVKKVSVDE